MTKIMKRRHIILKLISMRLALSAPVKGFGIQWCRVLHGCAKFWFFWFFFGFFLVFFFCLSIGLLGTLCSLLPLCSSPFYLLLASVMHILFFVLLIYFSILANKMWAKLRMSETDWTSQNILSTHYSWT